MDSELTNRCNSACPLCPRTGTFPGGVSKAIHESGWLDISLDHIDNICQHTNLKKFSYCGNYGDPVVHPKAFETLADSFYTVQELFGFPFAGPQSIDSWRISFFVVKSH